MKIISTNKVILKEGKERPLQRGHPWIFSGALSLPLSCTPGDILPIYSASGQFLAQGYFHPNNSLTGRILSFKEGDVKLEIKERLKKAVDLRKILIDPQVTNAYRLINAEGDGLPGFIVDVYDRFLVIQVHTYGIERLKNFLVEALIELFDPEGIYEKSTSASRKEEGLSEAEGCIYGKISEDVEIRENGLKFLINFQKGQKTGFFLDQREMRKKVKTLAKGRSVLNCFAYTGAFSLYALKGGASHVISVDSSKSACEYALLHTALNQQKGHEVIQEDVFEYLSKASLLSDFVILDPPAFVKKRKALDAAIKGYGRLNFLALSKLPKNAFLLTSSCSYYLSEEIFEKILYEAALRAERRVRVLSRHLQASDHPIDLNHPEGAYLKSLLLFVE